MSSSYTVEAVVPGFLLCVKRDGPVKSHTFKRKVLSEHCNSVFTSVTYSLGFVQGLDSPRLFITQGY